MPNSEDKDTVSRLFEMFVPDALKKAMALGAGAVFLTEEGIRQTVGDMKLPKDALHVLTQYTERARKDAGIVLSREMKKFLHSKDIEVLLLRVLDNVSVQARLELKFVTKQDTSNQPKIGLKLESLELDTSTQS